MTTNDNFSSFQLWGQAEGKEKAATPVTSAGTPEGHGQPVPLASTRGTPLSLLPEGLQLEKFGSICRKQRSPTRGLINGTNPSAQQHRPAEVLKYQLSGLRAN